jgi:uncharacterized protein YjeT (DUF2065 family)
MAISDIEKICQALDQSHRELRREAMIAMAVALFILLGLGLFFYLAPSESKRAFLASPTPSDASIGTILVTMFSELLLAVTAFYVARLLLHVVRHYLKLANNFLIVKFKLMIRQADPKVSIRDLDKLFGVDDREFLHDSTINSDLSSRVLRIIDKHKEDIKAGDLGQGQPGHEIE